MISPNKRAAILTLGAPRSGTSCLAHLLDALGAKLPEQLVEPAHSNVFGFWEPTNLICRLAPLYLNVLDVLAIEPLVILPLRHPVPVVPCKRS